MAASGDLWQEAGKISWEEQLMSLDRRFLVSAALAAIAAPSLAAAQSAPETTPALALADFPAKGGQRLKVTSPAFSNGGDIPFENTQYRGNVFPGLSWSKGPAGTRSYVVIMQDADVHFHGGPLLHWSMYDIPASMTALPAGMTSPPPGASFGPNVRGPGHAYMGPHTPPGPKHHYDFQVFALDKVIPADPNLTYEQLSSALKGHVLASGEVVGLGQADPSAAPPGPSVAH
jgi:para-nitrobenzyl esterase